MKPYSITLKFKNNTYLQIRIDSEENPREVFQKTWKENRKEGIVPIGNYLIKEEDICWLKVEGDKNLEKKIKDETT